MLPKWIKRPSTPPIKSALGAYQVQVVSHAPELDWDEYLPLEMRYLFKVRPGMREELRDILSRGFAIGLRTTTNTPERVLEAVRNISFYSQKNCILTWLPQFLRDNHAPTFTEQDRMLAAAHGADLEADLGTIKNERLRFKRFVLVDEDNVGIGSKEQRLMTDLSETIYPLAVDYIVHRIVNDNANERTAIAQSIIKALLFIGPIAHVLEHFASGIGKLFAASADDLMGEAAELMALRGSGFKWGELAKRGTVLVPVFALATLGALSIDTLLEHGWVLLAGAVFGVSAVALSLTTAIQSVSMYKKNVKELVAQNKVKLGAVSVLRMALIQDFTNPARLGLLLGAALAPFMGMLAAIFGFMSNGWVLAAVGSTESIVAGLTVILSNRINAWRFERRMRSML